MAVLTTWAIENRLAANDFYALWKNIADDDDLGWDINGVLPGTNGRYSFICTDLRCLT